MIEYLPRSKQHTELYVTQYGIEACSHGHYHGPAVRDYYLLHYIVDGEGIFEVGGTRYELRKGQGFLICPDVVTYYEADSTNPWTYCWFGFDGQLAESLLKQAGLTMDHPILHYDRDDSIYQYFTFMNESKGYHKARETRLTGLLYSLLSLLVEFGPAMTTYEHKESRAAIYVEKVKDFVETNFAQKITIEHIAQFIGLNRSYLCSLFQLQMSTSIQDYLIRYRIQRACEMMGNAELTIGDISRSVGYQDPLLFSKIFKKVMGASPKLYRSEARKI
ncbi:AraC-like DNA-binding protein [Paenibacillus cellulosilyticus]|uniref:AraC-like DNA-binding protein n=1 Tax=Paenibacillus cellulosilyticus TaxID=375489 RepID=A0A2V2YQS7_9BACL|nr:AraC family transcriptional regulator [Paenibacillus cellulosilyticus]PWV99366.1 AraC-like DNA-binding protein [Paenibacillus cellulosilyticus]QKS45130.1 AraC family transcriptional regulator [Paenibacillus cellulosilyticus]